MKHEARDVKHSTQQEASQRGGITEGKNRLTISFSLGVIVYLLWQSTPKPCAVCMSLQDRDELGVCSVSMQAK